MKKLVKSSILPLTLVVLLSSCSTTDKFIEQGYNYTITDGPAVLHKVWMPQYFKYHKKQKRYTFVNGHYRIILARKTWTYRQTRLRNRFEHL